MSSSTSRASPSTSTRPPISRGCTPHAAEARLQGLARSSSRPAGCSTTRSRPSASGWRSSASPTTSSRSATPAATAPRACPWLGALGERTDRALIGTSVLTPTMRYHPSMIAQAFATLACLNPGRIWLGVGTGEALNETPATGARVARREGAPAAARRGDRADAPALDGGARTFEGEYYRTERATIYDRPDALVPIYVAASGPLAAKLAGRDGRRVHHDQRQGAQPVRGADARRWRRARGRRAATRRRSSG